MEAFYNMTHELWQSSPNANWSEPTADQPGKPQRNHEVSHSRLIPMGTLNHERKQQEERLKRDNERYEAMEREKAEAWAAFEQEYEEYFR